MIIPTLGNGQLYRVHKEKYHMLTIMERRRAALIFLAIFCFVTLAIIIIVSGRPCPICQ